MGRREGKAVSPSLAAAVAAAKNSPHSPRLVLSEQLGRRSPARLLFKTDTGQASNRSRARTAKQAAFILMAEAYIRPDGLVISCPPDRRVPRPLKFGF